LNLLTAFSKSPFARAPWASMRSLSAAIVDTAPSVLGWRYLSTEEV
jgi:hypothetical protein